MRVAFGVLSLLIVVLAVGLLAKKQLQTVGAPPAGAASAGEPAVAVPQQAGRFQQQVRQDVQRALQQGAERASEARP